MSISELSGVSDENNGVISKTHTSPCIIEREAVIYKAPLARLEGPRKVETKGINVWVCLPWNPTAE